MQPDATLFAGVPASNDALFHRLRFLVGDPAAWIGFEGDLASDGSPAVVGIVRDIEIGRARRDAAVDAVFAPADFTPEGGLSGDRETATAQAIAECLVQRGVRAVRVDRSLPFVYAHHLQGRGIGVVYDESLGVADRRSKTDAEIDALRSAQRTTEDAMRHACETIAAATARADGTLEHDGAALTSERVRSMIDVFLLERGFSNPGSIVAGGPVGADCHDHGHGALRTGQPVIVDIFPRSGATRFNGDCTRCVVHGEIPDRVAAMHGAVIDAKRAAELATRAGATGQDVHEAAIERIRAAGFAVGLMPEDAPEDWCGMTHGTGHGIGLSVHEPPLLDFKGPELVVGDALTIEPGLYSRAIGGIRIEDMVIVREDGCDNLNELPMGLDWK